VSAALIAELEWALRWHNPGKIDPTDTVADWKVRAKNAIDAAKVASAPIIPANMTGPRPYTVCRATGSVSQRINGDGSGECLTCGAKWANLRFECAFVAPKA
jgi:hypothetical protein